LVISLVLRSAACGAALVILTWAGFLSLRNALADRALRSGGEAGAARAAGLAPLEARYWRELGIRRVDGGRELATALKLNPRDAQAWIEAGLRDEVAGDYDNAEWKLLEAARCDRTFGPRWVLANYYFRRKEAERFWEWARRSAEMLPYEIHSLAELCWKMDPEPERLRSILPRRSETLAQALLFASRRTDPQRCLPLARELVGAGGAAQVPALLEYVDRLLLATPACRDCVRSAVLLWDESVGAGLVPHGSLQAPDLSANPDFRPPLLGRGFDWRVNRIEGVVTGHEQGECGVRLSGRQPEACELLFRYSPVEAGRKHALRYSYAAPRLGPESGIYWRITDAHSGAVLAESPDLPPQTSLRPETLTFTPPDRTALVRISLRYQRRPGAVRAEGWVVWKRAELWVEN
jgi:hypothetical protein